MTPPRYYSVPPLYSFCTIPPRWPSPSFADALRAIWVWLRGKHRPVSLKRQIAEARLVERLSIELAEAAEPSANLPKVKGKSSKI